MLKQGTEERSKDLDSTICLTIEAKRQRTSDGAIHLVVPPPHIASNARHRPALIKAVARGRMWYEKIMNGQVVDIKSLAREAGLTSHYVRNVLACGFLAPDIVDAILDGQQPTTLTFADLYKPIPLSWAEQRKHFGFPPILL